MKSLIFILILSIVLSIQSTKTDVNEQTIMKMQNSQFGKNILNTIALELKNKDSADDLVQMLRDQEDKLQDEQSAEDDRILVIQNKCVVDLQRLVDQIEAAKNRIKEVKAELKVKIPLRDQKVEEREDLSATRDLLVEKIEQMDGNKEVKVAEYKEEMEQHDHAASIFIAAKSAIEDSVKSSFIQKKLNTNVFAQVSSTLHKERRNYFKRKSWNSVMKVMAQLLAPGVQADQSGVARVIEILENILESIAKSRDFERKDFQIWMEEYTKTRNALNKRLENVVSQINELTTQIDALNKRIELLREEQANQEQRVVDKTQENEEVETMCDNEAQAYSQRRQAYSDQIEVVSDAIALLTSQIRMLKKFISQKLGF